MSTGWVHIANRVVKTACGGAVAKPTSTNKTGINQYYRASYSIESSFKSTAVGTSDFSVVGSFHCYLNRVPPTHLFLNLGALSCAYEVRKRRSPCVVCCKLRQIG